MKLKDIRLLATGLTLTTLVFAMACSNKSTPTTPTPVTTTTTTTTVPAATLTAPAPKGPVAVQQIDTLRPTLSVSNATATGTVGTVTYQFEVSEEISFPVNSRTSSSGPIAQGADGTTTWVPPSDLIADKIYFWRARATDGTITTDWSLEAFKTKRLGGSFVGQNVFDPLTDGKTVGRQVGGHFVPGRGWQADLLTDGIDYDIPTCISCSVEFDVTNFGRKEGESFSKDLKWLSMGEAGSFGEFNAFRNHPWKMHLEQRGDGDGTGMKLIWRNGDAGEGEPGDHTAKVDPAIPWTGSEVYHFKVIWAPAGFQVWIDDELWFEDGFGGHPYAPSNHRISLGCYPRAETMLGAIFSNVVIKPY